MADLNRIATHRDAQIVYDEIDDALDRCRGVVEVCSVALGASTHSLRGPCRDRSRQEPGR